MKFTLAVKTEYENLMENCEIRADRVGDVDAIIFRILPHQVLYEKIGNELDIPWYFIAAIHNLECGLRFDRHFHNGDLLTKRTIHVPKGRPPVGNPPFTFEESAIDALTLEGFANKPSWTLPLMLFGLEKFNGFGYRRKGINSPYLWSFSNHYESGKFVADGEFSLTAVSAQCGGATLFKRMEEQALIEIPVEDS